MHPHHNLAAFVLPPAVTLFLVALFWRITKLRNSGKPLMYSQKRGLLFLTVASLAVGYIWYWGTDLDVVLRTAWVTQLRYMVEGLVFIVIVWSIYLRIKRS